VKKPTVISVDNMQSCMWAPLSDRPDIPPINQISWCPHYEGHNMYHQRYVKLRVKNLS
jgi:hypothetical protein